MDVTLLVKFLRHLTSCTETVLQKDEIESYDIIGLRRELSQLQRHLEGKEPVDPRILDKILGLQLRVNEGLLSDGTKGKWVRIATLLFHRSPLVGAERSRRLEELRLQLTRFRDEIDHLRFSIEFGGGSRTAEENGGSGGRG